MTTHCKCGASTYEKHLERADSTGSPHVFKPEYASYRTGILCAAVTSRSYGCLNPAKDGILCPAHDPRTWCGRPTLTGKPCKRKAGPDGGPCTKHAQ